jgi:NAD(P)-dependent dehydrogenase (short-subunit alcohol dehydrogenase family)
MSLSGNVAIITGGGGGLGECMALHFASLGASVVIADIVPEPAEKLAAKLRRDGAAAMAVQVDIADEASVRAMAEAVAERFGRVDTLVNNAALTNNAGDRDLLTTDLADWDRAMHINLRGTFLVSRHIVPTMIANGGGAVINIVSRQGLAPPSKANRIAYGVSKAGVVMLSRHIAVAYGKQGIRCNAVAPGSIKTQQWLTTLDDARKASSMRNVLTPDLGEPIDIARMVAYLAGEGGRYITGQTLQVDGGVLSYLHE